MSVLGQLDGTHNFRDVGGLPSEGEPTAFGVLYRSDALHALTPAGEAELAASDIGVIVDFRTEEERLTAPDRQPAARKIHEVHLPLLEGAMANTVKSALEARLLGDHTRAGRAAEDAMANLPSLGEMYVSMLTHGATSFAQLARLVAVPEDPQHPGVLVHCTAGKDRTGVATALLLDAVGVQRDAIIADYTQTEQNLRGPWLENMTAMVTRFGITITPALAEMMGGSPRGAIEQALAWIDARGGSAAYLLSGGLGDAQLSALRRRLVG